ncbi:MAG: hypothetical protein HY352_01095 [Candidatus Omnitrophica bacterium]|nr:hypothetical protein [Candidatus Omnitrophota bacterium]
MARVLAQYLHAIRHPATGLLESFADSADPELHGVTFTYDLALTALVFTHGESFDAARRILDFYRAMPPPDLSTPTYNVAYGTAGGAPALESAFQLGPLSWMAIALMRFAHASGEAIYFHKAVTLLDWVRQSMPHRDGGVAMGIREPWSLRMSVENDWAYYAALRMALVWVPDGVLREFVREETTGVRRWLARHERDRGADDGVKALDVYTNALLIGPHAHLEDQVMGDEAALARWARTWIEELEDLFRVPEIPGYDYTDADEAEAAGRERCSWLEGTEQVIVAYQTWAPFFESQGDRLFAQRLRRLAGFAHAHVIRCSLLSRGAVAIPNTDAPEPVRTFADGWVARPSMEPALNGTTWTYFAEVGLNPWVIPSRPLR